MHYKICHTCKKSLSYTRTKDATRIALTEEPIICKMGASNIDKSDETTIFKSPIYFCNNKKCLEQILRSI